MKTRGLNCLGSHLQCERTFSCTAPPLHFSLGNLSVGLCPPWFHSPRLACLCIAAEPSPDVSLPKMSRAPGAETCRACCNRAVCLLWTNGFVLHWKNWSQNVMSVFRTGIDCSFPKGSGSVTGFYFVVTKQNCSHTVKDNILAFSSWLRVKGNVRASVFRWGGRGFPACYSKSVLPARRRG